MSDNKNPQIKIGDLIEWYECATNHYGYNPYGKRTDDIVILESGSGVVVNIDKTDMYMHYKVHRQEFNDVKWYTHQQINLIKGADMKKGFSAGDEVRWYRYSSSSPKYRSTSITGYGVVVESKQYECKVRKNADSIEEWFSIVELQKVSD